MPGLKVSVQCSRLEVYTGIGLLRVQDSGSNGSEILEASSGKDRTGRTVHRNWQYRSSYEQSFFSEEGQE